ncbi:hypothetical protein N7E81_04755 [Reichenbachiella carrageenanivorans]|uniref:HTTM domain-containing protein n=1 Tax=Reichenbachiella carrageenanivorans TaxID=2979869 RepID=A0ABY6D2R1_9BACT|nr:hypothetical protein [Reichenbachiella carrageenanivorans]UXX80408.1 hypothetical protein N7E81_04755 [Reichenbachiella carrageenanivorans]
MVTKKLSGSGQKIIFIMNNNTPANILLILRLLAIYLLVMRMDVWHQLYDGLPYLPFIDMLNLLPTLLFSSFVFLILIGGVSLITLNIEPKKASLVIGITLILLVASSMPLYSTSLLYTGCLFILCGMSGNSTWPFRIQLTLLYIGTAVNKALDLDWWNGLYMHHFSYEVFSSPYYQILDSSWLQDYFAIGLGIFTFMIEIILAVLILIPNKTRIAITFGMVFHTGMLIYTMGQLSWTYFFLICFSYWLIAEKNTLIVQIPRASKFCILLKKIDLFNSIRWSISDHFECYKGHQKAQNYVWITIMILTRHSTLFLSIFILLMISTRLTYWTQVLNYLMVNQ